MGADRKCFDSFMAGTSRCVRTGEPLSLVFYYQTQGRMYWHRVCRYSIFIRDDCVMPFGFVHYQNCADAISSAWRESSSASSVIISIAHTHDDDVGLREFILFCDKSINSFHSLHYRLCVCDAKAFHEYWIMKSVFQRHGADVCVCGVSDAFRLIGSNQIISRHPRRESHIQLKREQGRRSIKRELFIN